MLDLPMTPPGPVRERLARLRDALDASTIPPRALDRNVLIATWNIRALGKVTERWVAGPADTPRRSIGDLACIAAIIERFDVVALQEVKRDLAGLRLLMRLLGPDWGWILTDLTRGEAGNQERMAFVYDTRRVKPSGLAAELVVPIEEQTSLTEATMKQQFARTPYAVSFASQGAVFTLVALHILWGDGSADRLPEIRQIARWMADWAHGGDAFGENLMALGDFNIDRRDDQLYQAFISTGLTPAPDHVGLPRTIFDDPAKPHFYDQIAWFSDPAGNPLWTPPLSYSGPAGSFDFRPALQEGLSNVELSWRISDHFPLWAAFSVRPLA